MRVYENERITSENVENGENETDISSHVNANVNFTATSVQIPWINIFYHLPVFLDNSFWKKQRNIDPFPFRAIFFEVANA